MLTVVCGPFHPHLEHALADDVVTARARDPLAPLLVVVPSESLRRRVAWLLARERGRAVLNLSVLTFHQLSRRLVEEGPWRRRPALTDDHTFEELTRLLLERGASGGPFAGVAATRGGCAALWQTLRDLKDAKVPPEALVDAVAEHVFPAENTPRLSALAALYRDVLAASRSAGWIDYTELDAAAVEAAPTSGYLQEQRNVCYYGFYDLTQAQYDLLRAVAARAETTVYFPFHSGDASWSFADRFYQRYLVGLTTTPPRVLDGPMPARPATVMTCSGANDEVVACAKEILRLVEEEDVGFDEIGVVARNLDPYVDIVGREFGRHGIPFVTTAQRGLTRFPLALAVVRLLRVAEGEPTRDDVIDLLSSPWCHPESVGLGNAASPALWSELARSIGVIRGYEGWARLAALSGPEGRGDPGGHSRGGQAAALLAAVEALRDACAALPAVASGFGHAEAWRRLLEAILGISSNGELDDDGDSGDDMAVSRTVMAAFSDPARLDSIRPTMTRQAYLEAVRRRLEAASLPISDPRERGVLVTDATAGRGVGFRVLFVLGLNDGVFPRVVREDAFLRDHDRRLIETTLGHKIPEKLAGFDEERLLFSSLLQAGRERLVLLTQRADHAGRPLAPSWYLAAWQRTAEGVVKVEIPRRTREKPKAPPFDRLERYTPREAATMAALLGAGPGRIADDRTAAFLKRAERLRRAVEAWDAGLSPFDGDLGPPKEWLAEVRARGYTATGLNRYAACPWRFFLTEVLALEPPADAEQRAGPTVRDWGTLAHEALARASRVPDDSIEEIWREACAGFGRRNATGYPLAWELSVERVGRLVADALADDREERVQSEYVPLETEMTLSGSLPSVRNIPIRGRLDRIDSGPDGRLRVIDWKFQWTRSRDRRADLVVAALRGQSLQSPLYAALARSYGSARGRARDQEIEVAVYAVRPLVPAPLVERTQYEPDADTAERIAGTIATLVDGIEAGVFPMIPDEYCARCEVSSACRRRHAPSRARAERDPRTGLVAGVRRTPIRAPTPP